MSDTLYLQLDQNIEVTNPHVYLQDIAALSMSDPKILNRLRVMPVMVLDETKPGRYVMSVSDLLKKIQKLEPSIDISPMGETDFIITYRISSATGKLFRYVKIFFVCLVSFFGAAFSIMTFNNDVDLGSLFDQFYTLVMGKSSDGFTILELSYSVGIGLGVLLFFSYCFYFLFSHRLIVYLLGATTITYLTGRLVATGEKKRRKTILIVGVWLLLGMLLVMKYSGFFAENVNALFGTINLGLRLPVRRFLLPLGISFYTLSAIGYMADVYWKKIEPEKNIAKLALFLSFFPIIMEGPICMYSDTAETLAKGEDIRSENLIRGYMRIGWGLLKKVVIADRLYVVVQTLFDGYASYHGVMIVVAAVSYTVQLYMEFSGCMDIVIGSAECFGVTLPENFAQPFVSKNASEFWRRWHISLGRWFKTYIFYPVSMSKLTRKWNRFAKKHTSKYIKLMVASAIALFPVWVCNGLWHGANWSYLFYGMYYFVVIMIELMLEPAVKKLCAAWKIAEDAAWWNVLRILKTWVIIFTGELFFRADTLGIGMHMFRSLFHDFSIQKLWDGTLLTLGLGRVEIGIILVSLLIVGVVNHFREQQIDVRGVILQKRLPVRWLVYLALIFVVLIFGAYGPGYQEVDLIYAGF